MAILQIPITKSGIPVSVDTDAIPEAMFAMAVEEGLKVMLNKGMSKIVFKGLSEAETDKAKADAAEIAAKNLTNLMEGKIKRGRTAAAKSTVPREVMTEAMRAAKEVVKQTIRQAGMKISHVPAKDITATAKKMVESDKSFIEIAKQTIAARAGLTVHAETDDAAKAAASEKLAALGFAGEDPKLVAKADKEKAERKSQLSAKQAGKPKAAPRKAAAQLTA